jgi:hypothetical protein
MPDPELVDAIKEIPVTDAHAHYVLNLPPGDPSKLLGAHPFQHPVGLRLDNPQWIEAWQELWGYEYDDMEDEHLKELIVRRMPLLRKTAQNMLIVLPRKWALKPRWLIQCIPH